MTGSRLKRFFPVEHGATAIWLYSTLAGLLSPKEPLRVQGLFVALAASVTLYFTAASLIRALKLSRHVRSSEVKLAAGSASLTLFMPLNHYILVENFEYRELAIWLLLVSYTLTATLSARVRVRNLLSDRKQFDLPLLGGSFIVISECLLLTLFNVLAYVALFSLTVLFLPALVDRLFSGGSRRGRIKTIGLGYMCCGLIFAAFISNS